MILREHRCGHCGVGYTYQASGGGAGHLNDATYCPACKEIVEGAIRAAMANCPRQFAARYRPVAEIPRFAEITLDTVLEWERQSQEQARAENRLQLTQIFAGLFDLQNGDSQNIRVIRGRDQFRGMSFKVMTWRHRPEHSIEIEMEFDLQRQEFTGSTWR